MYADLFDMFCFLHDTVVLFQFILGTHNSCKFSIKMKRINEDVKKRPYHKSERTKQMEEILNFQKPSEGLELVILLHTQAERLT